MLSAQTTRFKLACYFLVDTSDHFTMLQIYNAKIKEYMKKCECLVMMIVIIIRKVRPYSLPIATLYVNIWVKIHKILLKLEEQHNNDRLVDGLVQSVVPHR